MVAIQLTMEVEETRILWHSCGSTPRKREPYGSSDTILSEHSLSHKGQSWRRAHCYSQSERKALQMHCLREDVSGEPWHTFLLVIILSSIAGFDKLSRRGRARFRQALRQTRDKLNRRGREGSARQFSKAGLLNMAARSAEWSWAVTIPS